MEENTEIIDSEVIEESEVVEPDTETVAGTELVEITEESTESNLDPIEESSESVQNVQESTGSSVSSGTGTDYTEVLNDISETLTDMADIPVLSTYAITSSGGIDGYWFSYASDTVYIPYDKVSYFSKTEDGQLINLSSGTITCYSVASDGTLGNTYRFPAFGTAEKYEANTSGYGGTWYDIGVYAVDSNLILGQTGINNMTDLLLFFVLILLGILVFVRRK